MKVNGTKLELLTAKKAGLSRQTISATKMRGTCKPETLVKLADALDIDPAEIIEKGE